MTSTMTVQVPAGWYPDPVTRADAGVATQRRWWDGSAWSPHTAPFEPPSASIAAATPRSPLTSVGSAPTTVGPGDSARVAESMPLHAVPVRPSSPVSSADAQPHYEPFAHRRHHEILSIVTERPAERNPLGLRVHTVSVWLLATMPLTQAMLIFWVFTSLLPESSTWTRALAVALPFVLCAALAGQDTRQLEGSGHVRTAPWVAALFTPPIYLAVRCARVGQATGASPWPLAVWLVVQLAVIAAWWVLDPVAAQELLGQFV